jgi:hypothetical protein
MDKELWQGKTKALMNDQDIADLLRVSNSWVRQQRYRRRHGKTHEFAVEPIRIGSMPRYRRNDVLAWVEEQAKNSNASVPKLSDAGQDHIEARSVEVG